MATQKPISTISYNTEKFLKDKLDSLYDSHIIQAYMYIKHKGEDGDKDHIHLRIEPNKRVDPMELQDEFKEYERGSNLPLCCRPFRPSIEEDWFLYAVHDEDYLRLKYGGFEKFEKLPYDFKDIVVSPFYDLEVAFMRAKAKLKHTTPSIASDLKNGKNAFDLILQGENVHVVNAINRALYADDYSKLLDKYNALENKFLRYFSLTSGLLRDFGIYISLDDDMNYVFNKPN